jgi:hypothetical protein
LIDCLIRAAIVKFWWAVSRDGHHAVFGIARFQERGQCMRACAAGSTKESDGPIFRTSSPQRKEGSTALIDHRVYL